LEYFFPIKFTKFSSRLENTSIFWLKTMGNYWLTRKWRIYITNSMFAIKNRIFIKDWEELTHLFARIWNIRRNSCRSKYDKINLNPKFDQSSNFNEIRISNPKSWWFLLPL
jgi:hypothetical protein